MSLRALPYFAIVSMVAILTSCASTPAPVKSADASFKEAEAAYASRDYEEAIAAYKKVKESYSSPELSTQAELKIADAHFENKSYIEAAAAYEDFRKLHPSNPRAPYALYRAGLSHYHQITGIDTDQTPVKNAVVTLQSFLSQYPNSVYAPDARQKLAECRIKQLEYENYVGNFYLRTGKYPSAIKRLSEALTRFPNSPKLDETLFLLGKAHFKAGDSAQGRAALTRLLKEFPASPLKPKADELLKEYAAKS